MSVTVMRKPHLLRATQWMELGDHPDVKQYHSPQFNDLHIHRPCGNTVAAHGYIEHYDGGERICPGDWVVQEEHGPPHRVTDQHFQETYQVVQQSV